jgi:hypothetical protein
VPPPTAPGPVWPPRGRRSRQHSPPRRRATRPPGSLVSAGCRCCSRSSATAGSPPPQPVASRSTARRTWSATSGAVSPSTWSAPGCRSTSARLGWRVRPGDRRTRRCRSCSTAATSTCGGSSPMACACCSCGTRPRWSARHSSSSTWRRCSRARCSAISSCCTSCATRAASRSARRRPARRRAGWNAGVPRRSPVAPAPLIRCVTA